MPNPINRDTSRVMPFIGERKLPHRAEERRTCPGERGKLVNEVLRDHMAGEG